MEEKTFYIPRNLNSDFKFFSCYTMTDVLILLVLFMGGTLVALKTRFLEFYIPSIVYLVLRFHYGGYTIWQWSLRGISFLLGKGAKLNEYTLFERWLKSIGND